MIVDESSNHDEAGADTGDWAEHAVAFHERHGNIPCATFACSQFKCQGCCPAAFDPGFWGLHCGGWFELGMSLNPDGDSNVPVLFNDRADDLLVNQSYLFIENPVQADGSRWDVGGRLDFTYGTDSRFLTVPGLERHTDDTPKWNSESDRYGVAIPQAYAEMAAPVGQGLSVKAGHFYSITGFEAVPAPQNFFYSRSYAFVYGQPFTHTGVLASYHPGRQVIMQLGYTRGWDSWHNGADSDAVIGRLALTGRDHRTTLSAAFNSGRDVTAVTEDVPFTGERHLVNLVLAHQFTDRLTGVLQGDFGYQDDASVIVDTGSGSLDFESAKWGGVASYLFYELAPRCTSAMRLEWFHDHDQSRLGVPVTFDPGGPVLEGGNYYAMTAGLNLAPSPNVLLRPELRWDWSDLKGNRDVPGGSGAIRAFNERTSSDQFTAGADLIVLF